MAIYVQEGLTYPASLFIWMLVDTVQCVVMPLVWLNAYNGRPDIGGYVPGEMVLYYLMMAAVSSFVTCHLMWEFSMDIKEGILAQWLLRPVNVAAWLLVRNTAWRVFRIVMFLPVLGLCAVYYREHIDWGTLHLTGWFFLSVILGNLVSFTIGMAMSNLAFWVQEVQSVFGLYYLPLMLFSGFIIPMSLSFGWMQTIATILPFRYTIGVPVEISLGKLSVEQIQFSILMQLFWIVVGGMLGYLLWKRGLRQYSGVGM